MDYALQLLIPLLGGLSLGFWADGKWGISPWGTLAGLFIGFGLGMAVMVKRVLMIQDQAKQAKIKPSDTKGV